MSSETTNLRLAILNEFQRDYPVSAQFRGGRALRKGRWEQIFPGIETDPQVKDEFLSAAEELEAEGIISIKWARHRRGDRIEALYLKDPMRLHQLLGLPSPEQQREESLAMLKEFRAGWSEPRSGFTAALIEHLQARLEAFIPTPCDDPRNLGDLLTLLSADPDLIAELPLRALSVRLCNDSKRLERLLPQADKLSMAAAGEKLSDRFGLARNYPQTALRGELELVLQDGQSWRLAGNPLFVELQLAGSLALISAEAPVLVVENKETFMTLPYAKCGFAGLVYGGGHLNPAAAKLLRLVEQSGLEMYYFGDLDPDGLLIFQQAGSFLKGQLIPWHMDAETYQSYVRFGYPLSDGSVARLSQLHEPRLSELSSLIQQFGRGVEQEVIDVLSYVE
ncbi:MAG: Wadjet anti-phage system protein JetD domain-containing protein [Spirochaetota bacterium]